MGWRLRKDGRNTTPSVSDTAPATPTIAGFGGLTVIGHGSTATVFRARQDGFDREVAIKVLNVDISDRRAQKRFQRERSLNGRLSDHPNVVTVLDSGFVDGRYPYLAMEFFEQGSLADQLRAGGPFEVTRTLHIGVRIAGALETAHRLGVLHRDVKPHNILMSRFGEPALADFGIAAILEMEHSMTAALTPIHAAPELLEGADPTPKSDVYALGSTLYTLLAGAPPFGGPPGEGMLSQLLRIATTDVPALTRADMPPGLLELLRDCMAKRPEDRIASAEEMGQRLRDVQRGLNVTVSTLPVETLASDEPMRDPMRDPMGDPMRDAVHNAVHGAVQDQMHGDQAVDGPAFDAQVVDRSNGGGFNAGGFNAGGSSAGGSSEVGSSVGSLFDDRGFEPPRPAPVERPAELEFSREALTGFERPEALADTPLDFSLDDRPDIRPDVRLDISRDAPADISFDISHDISHDISPVDLPDAAVVESVSASASVSESASAYESASTPTSTDFERHDAPTPAREIDVPSLPPQPDPDGGTITYTQRPGSPSRPGAVAPASPTPSIPPSIPPSQPNTAENSSIASSSPAIRPATSSVVTAANPGTNPPVNAQVNASLDARLNARPVRNDREDFTISARQLHPVEPIPQQKRARWPWVAAIGGAIVGAATVGIVTVGMKNNDVTAPPVTTLAATTTTGPSGSSAPTSTIDYSQFAPSDVKVEAVADRVQVLFTDHTNGSRQHLLKLARSPGKTLVNPVITRADERFVILSPEINPNEPLCVIVSAIIDLPKKIFAEAKPVCINGAQPVS